MTNYSERITQIHDRIDSACHRADRAPEEITVIVVSKFHPSSVVRELHALGIRDFGENRHQEAAEKASELEDLDLNWHFVGQLQTKKARQAARYARTIHSVDRENLVTALAKADDALDVFLQVNLTDDPSRGGAAPADIESLVEQVLATTNLTLLGVMAVAPLDVEASSAFERLASYSERVQALAPQATAISAGMTHDFEEAIQFGATHLRIGTAITGKRPDAN